MTSRTSDALGAFLQRERFPSLDGLRCLAILPVVWHHSTPRPLEGVLGKGPLGVHLFFAISGFLITTLLLRERERHERIALGRFFARRVLRIAPLYYAVLSIYALRAFFLMPSSPLREHFLRSLPYYATYTGNWFVDYGVPHPVVFGFSWSLATEAQFYLLWPPVVALTRGFKLPALAMLGFLALDLAGENLGLVASHAVLESMVTSLSAPISLGSLLALGLHHRQSFRLLSWLRARASAPGLLLGLGAAISLDAPLFAIHLLMASIVGAVAVREDHGLAWLLDARGLRFIGEVSYGIYLLHVSVITAAKWLLSASSPLAVFAVAAPGSIAAAALTYRYFELPFLRRAPRPPRELIRSATPAS